MGQATLLAAVHLVGVQRGERLPAVHAFLFGLPPSRAGPPQPLGF